jgi:hypothetical protein
LPFFLVLAEFQIGDIRPLKEETASFMFNRSIKHFLQRSMSLFRYLGETSVRRGVDADC